MRHVLAFLCGAIVLLNACRGHAEQRLALVIGNDRYVNLPADQQLQKATSDARAVGDALERLGFSVMRGENLGRQGLVDILDRFTRRLTPGDVAFFFFAGHGVAINGGNHLLPSDIPDIAAGQEMRLARTALGEGDIVADLKSRHVRVAVVVIDACRNNPFKQPGLRSVGGERGLARIEPGRGIFSLYSAGIGQTALDRLGDGDPDPNSVFTRVLIGALGRPEIDLATLAIEVREEVARLAGTIGHDQRPAYYDETIGGRVYLAAVPRTGPDPANSAPTTPAARPVPTGRREPQRVDLDTFRPFDPVTGASRVWYWRNDKGDYEFYDAPGFHPRAGQALTALTRDGAGKLMRDLETQQKRRQEEQGRREREERENAEKDERQRRERAEREEREQREREAARERATRAGELCDRLAGNPNDRRRAGDGASYELLKGQVKEALETCEIAVRQSPAELRYQYQLARATQVVNRAAAFEMQKKLAAQSYPAAFDNLGWLYVTQQKDFAEATRQFRRGAALDDPDSMVSLAEMIEQGHAGAGDDGAARLALIERAADLGHPGAARVLRIEQEKLAKAEQDRAVQQEQSRRMMELIGGVIQGIQQRR
jgi:hypothetical protein